jgi:hypothetical protein
MNYGRAREPTDDSDTVIRHMRFACWINKATDTHTEYAIGYLLLFRGNRGSGNEPQYYVFTYINCLVDNKMQLIVKN